MAFTAYRGAGLFLVAAAMLAGLAACSPLVLSSWGSRVGANLLPRRAPHAGVDFSEEHGAPVIAALDGNVRWARDTQGGCGKGVALTHPVASPKGSRFTLYCHLDRIDVRAGQAVRRGDELGRVGTTGNAYGVSHVHFELSSTPQSHGDGDLRDTEDPGLYWAGCFDQQQTYPPDEFLLTYPVRCTK